MNLSKKLRSHVFHLANEIGERNVYRPEALHAAENYIRQSWQAMGYEVQSQEYEAAGVRSANLEINITGCEQADEILLVGAHYDSVMRSPGANDNGSGVACIIELARLFMDSSQARSLRFVAFVNEESPFFFTKQQGSMRYAKAMRQRGDNIHLMISLETIGFYSDEPGSQAYPPLFRYFYPDRANFVAFVSNLRSRRALRRLVDIFRNVTDFPVENVATFSWIPGVAWSDHLSFWRHGFRAVMVTDTAFYRYPYYHSNEDTADKLDYERLAKLTHGLHAALYQLAELGV
jgi:Zn-dependent M28 family amino/carboxypeptidase